MQIVSKFNEKKIQSSEMKFQNLLASNLPNFIKGILIDIPLLVIRFILYIQLKFVLVTFSGFLEAVPPSLLDW